VLLSWILQYWEDVFWVLHYFFCFLSLSLYHLFWLWNRILEDSSFWLFLNFWLNFRFNFRFNFRLNFGFHLFFFDFCLLLRLWSLFHLFFFLSFLFSIKSLFHWTFRIVLVAFRIKSRTLRESLTKCIKQLIDKWHLRKLNSLPINFKWILLVILNNGQYFEWSLFWMLDF
jgi:hypothetical protein